MGNQMQLINKKNLSFYEFPESAISPNGQMIATNDSLNNHGFSLEKYVVVQDIRNGILALYSHKSNNCFGFYITKLGDSMESIIFPEVVAGDCGRYILFSKEQTAMTKTLVSVINIAANSVDDLLSNVMNEISTRNTRPRFSTIVERLNSIDDIITSK